VRWRLGPRIRPGWLPGVQRLQLLGLSEAEGLLQETLVEEENTDEVLSELAENAINLAAA
jgi:ferritin-like metal-binding protein YciE